MKRLVKQRIALVSSLILLFGIVVYFYVNDYYRANATIEEYQNQYNDLTITTFEDYVRIDSGEESTKAVIFYPGGKVEYTAYIPIMAQLAREGYLTFIVEMPLHLAIFGVDKANIVISENPQIDHWIIGGHSLGGAMASKHVSKHEEQYEGIFFLGSYPAADLSQAGLKLVSLYGENDLIVNYKKIQTTMNHVPEDSYYYRMEGANHGGFGDYGYQEGDGIPTLTGNEQIEQTVEILVEQFKSEK